MARKRKNITAKNIEEVERLAALGLNQKAIGEYIGISDRTLRRRFHEDERVLAAYKKGRSIGHEHAASRLRNAMDAGEVAAIIFYLKTQCGWSVEKGESTSISAEQVCENLKAATAEFSEMHTETREE